MRKEFKALIEFVSTAPLVRILYVEGGRDVQFGSTFTGAWIEGLDNERSESETGLFYLNEANRFFFRRMGNTRLSTHPLGFEEIEQIPEEVMKLMLDSAARKTDYTIERKIKPPEKVEEVPDVDRFLILTGGGNR